MTGDLEQKNVGLFVWRIRTAISVQDALWYVVWVLSGLALPVSSASLPLLGSVALLSAALSGPREAWSLVCLAQCVGAT